MTFIRASFLLVLMFEAPLALAESISVRLANAPQQGVLVLQVYRDASSFGDFRNPMLETRHTIVEDGRYRIRGVPTGQIAVFAYVDENESGALDRTFVGIPKEPIGISNNYRPKGPPSFRRASFPLKAGADRELEVTLYDVLGEMGQWGVGLGVIVQSSPYQGSDSTVTQVIPAITYLGERLQWLGPTVRYGLLGSDRLRLALNATYRVGAYEEDDSAALSGLGDRDNTLMAGIGLVYDGPSGIDVDFRYQHDVLDRVGGGTAEFRVSRGFNTGNFRWAPSVGVKWLSSDLANYDFGVPVSGARVSRPAYDVGSSTNFAIGIGGMLELTEHWRVILDVGAEYLDDNIADSPIVDDRQVFKGFAAVTYTF
ncbi:MipA/OmpV family protein [Microbulbifer sp.]|uniref:MipA/OmpV family protein n=1 Tax=Microbulbifer sp. TaxID=1908541 RepID=UPI0025874E11|nr:MipA/OmpV family protein [Microbulbifer sp.]